MIGAGRAAGAEDAHEPPYVLCVDVGSPKNIGWADSEGRVGSADTIEAVLRTLGELAANGSPVALGFEAPIWTPRRRDLWSVSKSRGGVELELRRAWSAGAGCGVLAAALAVMPWCFQCISEGSGPINATTVFESFTSGRASLFVWEAFVTATAKGLSHHEDAAFAVAEFTRRWPVLYSDIPPEPALNHAASALLACGIGVELDELKSSPLVIAATPRIVL